MLRRLLDWLDDRTSFQQLVAPIRHRVLPNGPSWWFTSASCLLWLFLVELVTGLLLMTTYSPSMTSAWASVHFIEQSTAGTFIRGVHYFTSHALLVLFGVHVLRVVLMGAFRAPRELIWITGLILIPLMIVWSVTGNPLSASQKGFAQIEVEGNIAGSTPLVGPLVQRLLIGGETVGNLTLTHLYFLHVGLLPLLVIVLLGVHVWQVYRHGLSPSGPVPPDAKPYWPHQSIRNMIVLGGVVGVISYLAWRFGAPLDAPADPNVAHMPRPEWYFRCLFELRRYFTGDWEFIATMVIPGAVLTFFLALPLLDRICSTRVSAALRVSVVLLGVASWSWLTWTSFARDWSDEEFQTAYRHDLELAERARLLADRNQIPPEGATALLRDDAKTQGPRLFARHCASCHPHVDEHGVGIAASEPSAPNLFRIGSPEWIAGMLDPDKIVSTHYFGATKFAKGDMVGKLKELFEELDGDEAEEMRTQLAAVGEALAAEAALPAAKLDESHVADGVKLMSGTLGCTDCHKFRDEGDLGSAPDLTGYGSREWLTGMIADPKHERFYADDRNDRMPSFAQDAEHPERNLLSPRELKLLVDWLRGEWYEPGR